MNIANITTATKNPHKSLQPIRSSNSRSRLPGDQRSTTESTEIHGKENSNELPLSVSASFPGATPARRVGSFRGCPFVMIFLAVVIPDEDHGIGFVFACTSAEIEPKTIVAYGLTFSCRLALFAPFSNFAAPVAARWHCTAPTTELRKTHSEFAPSRPRSFMQIQISGMPNRCGMAVGQPFLSHSFQSPAGVCRLSRRCRRTR